jgi:hypothetical protein
MSYRFLNIVDLQSRQYSFDIEKKIKIKTNYKQFEVTLEDLKQDEIFELVNSKIVFEMSGENYCFSVNPNNIVGIIYTIN